MGINFKKFFKKSSKKISESPKEKAQTELTSTKLNTFKSFIGKIKKNSNTPSEQKKSFKGMGSLGSKLKSRNLKITNPQTWRNLNKKIFDPSSRSLIHKYFLMTSITFISWGAGSVMGLFLSKPQSTAKQMFVPTNISAPSIDTNSLISNNIFDAKTEDVNTKNTTQVQISTELCKQADQISNLQLTLLSTVVLQDDKKSVAAIQSRSGQDLERLRVGDTIAGQIKIGHIGRLEVFFRNLQNGKCEKLVNDKAISSLKSFNIVSPKVGRKLLNANKPQGIKNNGNSFEISKDTLKKNFENINEILTQARAIPIKNPDGTLSYKIVEIVPGSIYSHLGIQENDIITKIDGKQIKAMNEVFNMYGRLQSTDDLSLTVKRDGMDVSLDYKFY